MLEKSSLKKCKNIRLNAIVLPVSLFVNILLALLTGVFPVNKSGGIQDFEINNAMGASPPGILKQVSPVYPQLARLARVEGVVVVEATTDIYGRVAEVKVVRSIPLLDQAAVEAVSQFIFEPMVIDSKSRCVVFILTVKFQLT